MHVLSEDLEDSGSGLNFDGKNQNTLFLILGDLSPNMKHTAVK